MFFKDITLKFNKSSNIVSKVPWKNDIYKDGLIFYDDAITNNKDVECSKYVKIQSRTYSNNKFKLNTNNVDILKIEYFYNGITHNNIITDSSHVDYLFSFILDVNDYLKISMIYDSTNNINNHNTNNINNHSINIYNIKKDDNTIVNNETVFDKIYIINLEHRKDRKDSVIKQLEKENITNYEFITAVNGNDDEIINLFKNIRKNGSKIGTLGHLGCLLSHKKVLMKAKEDNVNSFMILEDDIILKDGFINRLNSICIPDWECIYLSAPLEEKKMFLNGWAKHYKYCTTHAMIIKASIIDYLLQLLENNDDYIDRIYSYTLQKHKKTYLLNDIVLTSDVNDTNTSRKNKKFLYMIKNYNLDL
jgi:GR25 family glycosyltransferase involved in LPS biosynthesis